MKSQLLHFTQTSDTHKPKIVFLHGGGSSSWMWELVSCFLPQYNCIAVDLPQHGKSENIAPFSLPYAAEKVAELIDFLSPNDPVHLVGLSEGAQVAIQMLVSHSRILRSVFASSPLLLPVWGTGILASEWATRWAYLLALQPFKNWNYWIRLNMKFAAGVPEQFYVQFKQDFQNTTEESFVNLMVSNQRFRLPEGLEQTLTSVLAVCGHKEYRAMQNSVRLLSEVLPNATSFILELGKSSSLTEEHNWALTHPRLFADAVCAWIENKDLPSELRRQVQ